MSYNRTESGGQRRIALEREEEIRGSIRLAPASDELRDYIAKVERAATSADMTMLIGRAGTRRDDRAPAATR